MMRATESNQSSNRNTTRPPRHPLQHRHEDQSASSIAPQFASSATPTTISSTSSASTTSTTLPSSSTSFPILIPSETISVDSINAATTDPHIDPELVESTRELLKEAYQRHLSQCPNVQRRLSTEFPWSTSLANPTTFIPINTTTTTTASAPVLHHSLPSVTFHGDPWSDTGQGQGQGQQQQQQQQQQILKRKRKQSTTATNVNICKICDMYAQLPSYYKDDLLNPVKPQSLRGAPPQSQPRITHSVSLNSLSTVSPRTPASRSQSINVRLSSFTYQNSAGTAVAAAAAGGGGGGGVSSSLLSTTPSSSSSSFSSISSVDVNTFHNLNLNSSSFSSESDNDDGVGGGIAAAAAAAVGGGNADHNHNHHYYHHHHHSSKHQKIDAKEPQPSRAKQPTTTQQQQPQPQPQPPQRSLLQLPNQSTLPAQPPQQSSPLSPPVHSLPLAPTTTATTTTITLGQQQQQQTFIQTSVNFDAVKWEEEELMDDETDEAATDVTSNESHPHSSESGTDNLPHR